MKQIIGKDVDALDVKKTYFRRDNRFSGWHQLKHITFLHFPKRGKDEQVNKWRWVNVGGDISHNFLIDLKKPNWVFDSHKEAIEEALDTPDITVYECDNFEELFDKWAQSMISSSEK